MNDSSSARRKRLAIVLSVIFALAIVLGGGPGMYLVNPDTDDPDAAFTFLGMPIIYAWIVFWFLVQAGVVLVAYYRLWDGTTTADSRPKKKSSGTTGVGQAVPDGNQEIRQAQPDLQTPGTTSQ